MLNEKCVFLYAIFSGTIALCIFLYGYVPVFSSQIDAASRQDLPTKIDGSSVDPERIYHSDVQKLVIIVIDSLSIDFFTDYKIRQNLPHVTGLIARGDACLVPCNVPPPTTTIQKIKALATGTRSSFIESILPLSAEELKMDSIFRQAVDNKFHLILHGVETWKQLFPDSFLRAKTIDTLKIFDYSETDANVTKTLSAEVNENDWNWLLLHYLGLKSLSFNRNSNLEQVSMKLRELDAAIKFTHSRLSAQKSNYRIVIVGDTGMGMLNVPSDANENPGTLAPYIVIGAHCRSSGPLKLMGEVDLAPTLAVLTGLPIPSSSYGCLNSVFLNDLTDEKLLYALHYNTARLMNLTSKLGIKYADDPAYVLFENAINQHGRYLRSVNLRSQFQLRNTIRILYIKTTEYLSKRINDFLNTSDVPIQYLAFVLIFEAVIILVNQMDENTANRKFNFFVIFITNLMVLTWVLATGMSKRGTSFIYMTSAKGFIIANVTVLMCCNSYIMATQKSFLTRLFSASAEVAENSKESINTISSRVQLATSKQTNMNSLLVLLVSGTIVHAASLLELSYIKQEKWVWFFLWTSMCFFIIYKHIGKVYQSKTPETNHEFLNEAQNVKQEIVPVVFSILIMHRTIMAYTAVENWVSHGDNRLCTSVCLILGLVLLAFTCSIYYEPFTSTVDKFITRILLGFICCSIYVLNAARGNVILPNYPESEGGLEMMFFWLTWISIMGYGIGFCTIKTCYKGMSSSRQLIAAAITCWACFAALLSRSHKVLLISVEMLFGQAISDVFKKHNQCSIFSHVWLGHLFFHHQGYTYSLDSIDMATGLLFSKKMCTLMYGVLLVINTFSAPVLSYLICIHGMLTNNSKTSVSQGISEVNMIFGYCRFFLIAVYLLGMLVHRHNKWLWSILSPKLLYEVVYTFLIVSVMMSVQVTGLFHDLSVKLRIPSTEST